MAETNTYGSRDKNPFILEGVPGKTKYYLLVDSKTGEITIKSPTIAGDALGASADRTVGTISNIGKFKPELGFITTDELRYFSNSSNINSVRNHAVITSKKGGAPNPERLIFPNRPTTPPTPTKPGPVPPGPNQPGANQPDANQPPPLNLEQVNQAIPSIESVGVRGSYNNGSPLKYPLNLDSKIMDVIKFEMIKYVPQKFKKEVIGFANLKERFGDQITLGTVVLGIQPSIQDENRVTWSTDDISVLQAGGAQSSLSFMNDGDISNALKPFIKTIEGATPDIVSATLIQLAQNATGSSNLLSRIGGAISNPNLQLLFTSPELRSFSFTFKMSPREEGEAKNVRKIIRFFKEGSSVQRSNIALFLKAPNVFRLTYLHKDNTHQSLNRFKICALTSVSVDYTPMGSYMTFTDGNLVSYNLSLQFQELEPIYANNYSGIGDKDSPNESVGY